MEIPYFIQNLWETRKTLVIVVVILVVFVIVSGLVLLFIPKNKIIMELNIPREKVELIWWKPKFPQMNSSSYRNIIGKFRSINPNVNIKIIDKTYGPDYYRDLLLAMAGGEGPDIFSIHNNDLRAYLPYISPISTFQNRDPNTQERILELYKRDFVDMVVRDTISQDQVYGITSYVDNMQMYVNRDLLNQAGIPLPARTWDDLLVQIPALTRQSQFGGVFEQSAISLGTGNIIGSPVPNIDKHHEILPLLIFQKGNPIYDNIKEEVTLNRKGDRGNNPSLEAINFYYSFADPKDERYTWSNTSPNNVEAFTSGRLAYIIHYSYFASEIQRRNPRLNFEVVPLPQFDGTNRKTFGFFYMDVLSKRLEQNFAKKYWAEQFMLYLSQSEQQKELAAITGFPPARRDVIQEQLLGDRQKQVFAQGALIADSYYRPDPAKTERIWSEMIYRMHFENRTAAQVLDDAVKEYQALVRAGPKPR